MCYHGYGATPLVVLLCLGCSSWVLLVPTRLWVADGEIKGDNIDLSKTLTDRRSNFNIVPKLYTIQILKQKNFTGFFN